MRLLSGDAAADVTVANLHSRTIKREATGSEFATVPSLAHAAA